MNPATFKTGADARVARLFVAVAASLIVMVTAYVAITTFAAGPVASAEAENGTISAGADQMQDGSASQSSALLFGRVSAPVTNPSAEPLPPADVDHREYMHGVEFVKTGGRHLLLYASNQYPPVSPAGEWEHDIFYSEINPADPNGSFSPKPLVSAVTAQEPASGAVNSNGKLLVTSEDAQFSPDLDQTYGIWDGNLAPLVPYGAKLMPPQGGHSGHAAASGDKFLVSFSDGWVDGGGVDNLGTGDDIFGKIVNDDGTAGQIINTAVGTDNRDWWPIVAGSDTGWLQVWQRYGTAGTGGGTVMGALIDHSGAIVKELPIYDNNKYYYYDVQYVPSLGAYLVVGSQNTGSNEGVAVLVSKSGTIIASKTGLPSTVRESQTVVSDDGKTAVYTVPGTGVAVLDLTSSAITLRKEVPIDWNWDYMGTDGIFVGGGRVLFATGTQAGIRFITAQL
ncbi:hypothetical protein JNJ66_03735 [Candidatus Saccharibacteria bacterium]|nr:hypothetical protein [Candidatus Saccharibacteria bacterium]